MELTELAALIDLMRAKGAYEVFLNGCHVKLGPDPAVQRARQEPESKNPAKRDAYDVLFAASGVRPARPPTKGDAR